MKTEKLNPVVRLVRETTQQLRNGDVSPACAFRILRFATDGSDEPDAWSVLAGYYRNGIGCERNEQLALEALRKSGKVNWLLTPDPESDADDDVENDLLNEEGFPMDGDELAIKLEEDNRLVDMFLDWEEDDNKARYAQYDPANPGCNPDQPIIVPRMPDDLDPFSAATQELMLDSLICPIPYRCVDYQVVESTTEYHGGRPLDHVKVAVYTHPLLTEDPDGNLYLPHQRFLGYEDYWFQLPDDPEIDQMLEDYYAGRIL